LLTSEKEKVNDLIKKYSLVEDTNAKFQESFTSLQAIYKTLEVEHNTTLESNSKLVRNLVHPFHQQVMVVHVVITLIFKLVLLTILR